jgi:hypothetical protein
VSDDDLILVREVEARRALGNRSLRLAMLVPFGAWIGQGALRVLRVRVNESESDVELTVGYESYRPCVQGS